MKKLKQIFINHADRTMRGILRHVLMFYIKEKLIKSHFITYLNQDGNYTKFEINETKT